MKKSVKSKHSLYHKYVHGFYLCTIKVTKNGIKSNRFNTNYIPECLDRMAHFNLPSVLQTFACDLYEQIQSAIKEDRNIVISPLSVHMAMTVLLNGAFGLTAKELARALKLGDTSSTIVSNEFEAVLRSLTGYFQLANKIYIPESYKFKTTFQTIAESQFDSETQVVDFKESEDAADKINAWFTYKTSERIKKIVSPDFLDETTKLVLVNAVYFKGLWEHQFDVDRTKLKPFFNSETDSVEVSMMHKSAVIPFANLVDLPAKAVVLDFENSTQSMVIVLPNERNGLATVEAALRRTNLASIVEQTESKSKVILSLPKFCVEMEIELSDTMRKMGMRSIFSSSANFSEMLEGNQRLYVTDILHKAVLDVNEKGTIAKAAVKLDLHMSMPTGVPVSFNANHPFRYFIRNTDNVVLFSGCFRNAKASKQ